MSTVLKAVALDLDGTLLNSRRTIGPHSLAMIEEAVRQGWKVIIATARPVRSIRQFLPSWFEDFYWAACNGAWILKGGRVLERVEIPHRIAVGLIRVLRKRGLPVMIEAEDKLFTDEALPASFIGQHYKLDELGGGDVCKVLVRSRSQEQVDLVRSLTPAVCADVVTDDGSLVQIAHKDCNKLNAVARILSAEGLGLDSVIAFGDDANDIPLVAGAGCGVAMGNATAALKAVADHVTATNDEDGVGKFLEGVLA